MNFEEFFQSRTNFLSQYKWIFWKDNVRFVKEGILDELPEEWVEVFEKMEYGVQFNELPFEAFDESWPESFKAFLLELRALRPNFHSFASYEKDENKISGVGLKKMHEIHNLSNLIGELVPRDTLIVDFGSGLGYLSQLLFDRFQYNVIGIEGFASNYDTSMSRQLSEFPKSTEAVHYIQHFITEDSLELLRDTTKGQNTAIVGLHACADLTITAIKMFFGLENVRQLLIMPCCYHRLELDDPERETFKNLPLSSAFKSALDNVDSGFLNIAFARLACQHSAVRWRRQTPEEHRQHGKIMFERALVDLLASQGETIRRNSNTRRLDGQSWEAICSKYTLMRGQEVVPWTDEHRQRLEELRQRYPDGERRSQFLKCLQNCVQGLCEHVIMVDRLAFVEELCRTQGLSLKTLEYRKIVDDDLSPRGFVLIVEK